MAAMGAFGIEGQKRGGGGGGRYFISTTLVAAAGSLGLHGLAALTRIGYQGGCTRSEFSDTMRAHVNLRTPLHTSSH